MRNYSLSHVSDALLLRRLAALVTRDRINTTILLAHIAEVDDRRLYAPAGHSSMFAYCVEELRLSEDAAYKRIRAARAARRFPSLLGALAEGRLHLAAVYLLAPHLTPENADELIEAATHKGKFEIEEFLARRFQVREARATLRPFTAITAENSQQLAPGPVGMNTMSTGNAGVIPASSPEQGIDSLNELAPGPVDDGGPQTSPPSPERYVVQAIVSKSTHDKLRYAQALLRHAVPSGDVGEVLDRALTVLITHVEKRKAGVATDGGATTRVPRPRNRGRSRYVPAHIRRAVWDRDQGRCTFVSRSGRRCESRSFLEFDHVHPFARGGSASVEGMRLRCRTHNQYEAERAFGAGLMRRKRDEARRVQAQSRGSRDRTLVGCGRAKDQDVEVIAGLRRLGCRADEARYVVESCGSTHGAPLEERMRAALKLLGERVARGGRPREP